MSGFASMAPAQRAYDPNVRVSPGTVRAWHGKYQGRFSVTYIDADGASVRKQLSRAIDAKTEAAARRALPDARQDLKEQITQRLVVENAYPDTATELGGYMGRYVSQREAAGIIEPTTAANYRASARQIMRHMDPHKALADVSAADIRDCESGLLGDGLSPETVAKCFRFLKQVLAAAADEGRIAKSPFTRDLRPPKRARREPDGLDEETTQRLLRTVDGMVETPLVVAIRMTLLTTMRNEEALGLRWGDVELDRAALEGGDAVCGTIHVRNCITTAAGKVVEKGPKTAAGRRDIPLVRELAEVLERRAAEEFGARGIDDSAVRDEYVLGTPGGHYYNPTMLTREFSLFAKQYDLRCTSGKLATFYALRHTAITMMVRSSTDIKTIASIAGHAKVAETLDIYATTDTEAKRRVAALAAGRVAAMSHAAGGELRP